MERPYGDPTQRHNCSPSVRQKEFLAKQASAHGTSRIQVGHEGEGAVEQLFCQT